MRTSLDSLVALRVRRGGGWMADHGGGGVSFGLRALAGGWLLAAAGLAQVQYQARIVVGEPGRSGGAEERGELGGAGELGGQVVGVELVLRGIPEEVERLELRFAEQHSFVVLEPRFAEEPSLWVAAGAGAHDGAGAGARQGAGQGELVLAEGARLKREGDFVWALEPGGYGELTIRYGIRLDHRRDARVVGRDEYEQPYLAEDHGLLMSSALLMAPEELSIEGVRFELPEGWGIEAPWAEREPGVFVPENREALVNDLIAVGDWLVERSQAGGVDLSVAFAPGQERLKELLAKDLTRIVGAELGLFGIQPHRRYLLLFGRPEMPSFCGGSPKTGSMTLAVAEDLPVEFSGPAILHLVAHEYHHTWMMAQCQPAHEMRFVMEGFTDWFAYRVLDQLELQPAEALEETLLKKLVLGEQALAEFGESLAAAGGAPFFSGGAPYDACYAAGLGLAAWTEVALRRAGSELDLAEFLRRIYNDPRWQTGQQPQLADFFGLLRKALGARAEAWLPAVERAVTVPGALDWVGLFGLLELPLERDEVPLDATPRANFEGTTVTALDPAGAAGRLGLMAGDRLLEVQGQAVSDAAGIRGLWRADGAGQIALKFERAGETLEVREPYPKVKVLRLAGQQASPFRRAVPGTRPR